MPHLSVQYTDNVKIDDSNALLNALNKCLWDSKQFAKTEDLKSRILPLSTFLVGTNDERPNNQQEDGFVYLHLKLMAGRSDDTKQQLAENLANICKKALAQQKVANIQVCAEVEEISNIYHKFMV